MLRLLLFLDCTDVQLDDAHRIRGGEKPVGAGGLVECRDALRGEILEQPVQPATPHHHVVSAESCLDFG